MRRKRGVAVPAEPPVPAPPAGAKVLTGTVVSGLTFREPRPRRGPRALPAFCRRHSFTVLRVSVGLLFVWFGALKLLPGFSPAEDLATRVMSALTADRVPADLSRPLLAMMEMLIGAGLVTGLLLRLTLFVFFVHMAGTLSALVVLPGEMWDGSVAFPTMAGQYVLKNVVLLAAGLAVAAHLRSETRGPDDDW
ncbi:DoxX family protein [Streptomyces sp. TRM 70361]|uniref:DoxX family protein n=1 Tax=Streptomyces sp. TRM 70361 TaxID=3116553 RepID=UPI002E7B9D61|nr:DoxX family protein [Streptomyces sp. TRM 70361]MEE1937870.1 DoxX family protein [Streptomyces sp. TRM 70361]